MSKLETTIRRKILYKQIWKTPATEVCKKYGISSSMLARICTAMNVPRPSRGYWPKVKNGQKIDIPKLPSITSDTKESWVVKLATVNEQKVARKKKIKQLEQRESIQHDLAFLKGLEEPKFVKATRKALKGEKPNYDGLISPNTSDKHIGLLVSPDQLERALSILTMVIYVCEQQGFKAVCELTKDSGRNHRHHWDPPASAVKLEWDGEPDEEKNKATISIREGRKRYLKDDSDEGYRYSSYDQYEYRPTGLLTLTIDYSKISDKITSKIEDQIPSIGIQLLEKYIEWKFQREECNRQQEYNKMISSFEQDWDRQKERESKAFSKVIKQAARYEQATSLRNYLSACEERLQQIECSESERRDYELKLQFIKTKLQEIDPFTSSDAPWDIVPIHTATGTPPPSMWD